MRLLLFKFTLDAYFGPLCPLESCSHFIMLDDMVKEAEGFEGEIVWDKSKPDGTPRKLMDCSTIANLGWKPKISLRDGLVGTYEWYVGNVVKQ
ncbi:hypothetical protein L1887_31700 [Cichorium endivia]|nr:hypothetical protein L1887_31700 [Cichorium endivia]